MEWKLASNGGLQEGDYCFFASPSTHNKVFIGRASLIYNDEVVINDLEDVGMDGCESYSIPSGKLYYIKLSYPDIP